MKHYTIYLGSSEQFAYTWDAKNLKELRKKIEQTWPMTYSNKRWFKVDASGCPSKSKRFYINNNSNIPVLIIPRS